MCSIFHGATALVMKIKFWRYVWILSCVFTSFNECFAAVSNIFADFSNDDGDIPFLLEISLKVQN